MRGLPYQAQAGRKKKGSNKSIMVAMNEDRFYATCHDGKKAFSVKSPACRSSSRP
jgi:hypothetical protein